MKTKDITINGFHDNQDSEYISECIQAYRLYYASKADTIDMRWTNASRHFFNEQEIAA